MFLLSNPMTLLEKKQRLIKRIRHIFFGDHFFDGKIVNDDNYQYQPKERCMFCDCMIMVRVHFYRNGEKKKDYRNVEVALRNSKDAIWDRYYPTPKYGWFGELKDEQNV